MIVLMMLFNNARRLSFHSSSICHQRGSLVSSHIAVHYFQGRGRTAAGQRGPMSGAGGLGSLIRKNRLTRAGSKGKGTFLGPTACVPSDGSTPTLLRPPASGFLFLTAAGQRGPISGAGGLGSLVRKHLGEFSVFREVRSELLRPTASTSV